MRTLANDAIISLLQLGLLYVSREEQKRKRVRKKKNRAGGGWRKGPVRVPPQPSPCFKERKFENCGKIKLSSCVLSLHSRCGKEAEEGEKRRGNWKDGGSSFFFPSLSPDIFTKSVGLLLDLVKKLGTIF